MERPTMIDLSADAIGQPWTVENHQALVCHLKAVERLAQDVIALNQRQHEAAPAEAQAVRVVRSLRPAFHADGDPDDDAPRLPPLAG